MDKNKLDKSVDRFLTNRVKKSQVSNDGMETEECDLVTGECYILRSKDGIIERINKKYITDDGRQLLQD